MSSATGVERPADQSPLAVVPGAVGFDDGDVADVERVVLVLALPVALVDVAVVLIAAWDVAGFAAELEPPHAALDAATAASATPAMSTRRL